MGVPGRTSSGRAQSFHPLHAEIGRPLSGLLRATERKKGKAVDTAFIAAVEDSWGRGTGNISPSFQVKRMTATTGICSRSPQNTAAEQDLGPDPAMEERTGSVLCKPVPTRAQGWPEALVRMPGLTPAPSTGQFISLPLWWPLLPFTVARVVHTSCHVIFTQPCSLTMVIVLM